MAPPSRNEAGDGRAHRRTTSGPRYQVPRRTTSRTSQYAGPVPVYVSRMSGRPGLLLALVLAAIAGGCSTTGDPTYASFDPASVCTTDGRFPGAYPDLEARVPKTFENRAPDELDSGRNCSQAELGTLAGHGISEVRYAGGTWRLGSVQGVSLAVFSANGLTAGLVGEWYEASARAARNTRNITPSRPTVDGRQGYRLDTVNGESSQTVVTWDAVTGDAVFAVVTADVSETRIQAAVAAFAGH